VSLNKTADNLLKQADQFQRLRDLGNRKNYPHKVKLLHTKISEEYNFWSKKEPSQKLLDIEKDRNFIQSIKEPTQNKERIDILMNKYGLK